MMSALDIQERFLDCAVLHCKGQDEETDWVLTQWASVLHDLRGDYQKLVGRVTGRPNCGCWNAFEKRSMPTGLIPC